MSRAGPGLRPIKEGNSKLSKIQIDGQLTGPERYLSVVAYMLETMQQGCLRAVREPGYLSPAISILHPISIFQ